MTAWRHKISFLMLKKISLVHFAHSGKLFKHSKKNFVSLHGYVISFTYISSAYPDANLTIPLLITSLTAQIPWTVYWRSRKIIKHCLPKKGNMLKTQGGRGGGLKKHLAYFMAHLKCYDWSVQVHCNSNGIHHQLSVSLNDFSTFYKRNKKSCFLFIVELHL